GDAAPDRLFTRRVCRLPVGVDVTASKAGTRLGMRGNVARESHELFLTFRLCVGPRLCGLLLSPWHLCPPPPRRSNIIATGQRRQINDLDDTPEPGGAAESL